MYGCVCVSGLCVSWVCVSVCVCRVYACPGCVCVCVCARSACVRVFVCQRMSWVCVCARTDTSPPRELTEGLDAGKSCIQATPLPPLPAQPRASAAGPGPKPPTPQHNPQPQHSLVPSDHRDSQPPSLGPLQPQTHIASRVVQSKASLLLHTWVTDLHISMPRYKTPNTGSTKNAAASRQDQISNTG